MKKVLLIGILLIAFFEFSHSEIHHKVKIKFDSKINNSNIFEYCSDILSVKKDLFVIAILDDKELSKLKYNNLNFEVLEENVEANYAKIGKLNMEKQENKMQYPSYFSFGSMGGYYTFEEAYKVFDLMKSKYPEYFADEEVIGSTIEKRDIKCFIFGNKALDKPKVQLNSLIHAREGGGLTAIAYYMWTLLEKAKNGDESARFLLNNREIYIIPVVNPDGVVYNYNTNPSGGGMWRKNRKKTSDSTYGIDLNRNFGPYEYWDSKYTPNGSSTNINDITYRGSAPFSEPETQALRDYALENDFKTALCYHTYSNDLIYSYSALPGETPDSSLFRGMAIQMSKKNHYIFGTDQFTVGYGTRGSSDDWFYYTDSEKKYKTLALTPEVGNLSDGFWTTKERILDQCLENIEIIDNIIWSAETNIKPIDLKIENKFEKDQANLILKVQNIGVKDYYDDVNILIKSLDNDYKFNSETEKLVGAYSGEINEIVIYLPQPDTNFVNGKIVKFEVSIAQDNIIRRDTFEIQMYYYNSIPLFANGVLVGNWDKGNWGFQFDSNLGKYVLTDSPDSLYTKSTENIITYLGKVLIDRPAALAFKSYWQIETNYDFAKIEISADGGKTWENVSSPRMYQASGISSSKQKNMNEYGFHGYYPLWLDQTIDLSAFLGKEISIRIIMSTDEGANYDGIFFENIEIRKYEDTRFTNVVENENRDFSAKLKSQNENNAIIRLTQPIDENNNVSVFNLIGERISLPYKMIDNQNLMIDISKLQNGCYFVKLQSGKNTDLIKIIK